MGEPTIMIVIPVVLVWIAAAVGCYVLAQKKGRNPILWALLGFVLPIVGLVLIAILPTVKSGTH